jgi:hypothetical protein
LHPFVLSMPPQNDVPQLHFPVDSLMHIRSIDVVPSLVYPLTRQCHIFLCKNSTADVPVVSMSWIIVCTNYIFTLYAFPFAHSEDDDECDGDMAHPHIPSKTQMRVWKWKQ